MICLEYCGVVKSNSACGSNLSLAKDRWKFTLDGLNVVCKKLLVLASGEQSTVVDLMLVAYMSLLSWSSIHWSYYFGRRLG